MESQRAMPENFPRGGEMGEEVESRKIPQVLLIMD
jgi:hypothetical protein